MAMSTTSNSVQISNLVINKVPSQEVFQAMQTNGNIQANELYLVEGLYSLPPLTIGNYTYNGTTAVNVPIYNGNYEWFS